MEFTGSASIKQNILAGQKFLNLAPKITDTWGQ